MKYAPLAFAFLVTFVLGLFLPMIPGFFFTVLCTLAASFVWPVEWEELQKKLRDDD